MARGLDKIPGNYDLEDIVKLGCEIFKWARIRSGNRSKPQQLNGELNKFKRCYGIVSSSLCGKRSGRQLVTFYLLTKVLYLVNSVAQGFLISQFLKVDIHKQAISALRSLVLNEQWESYDHFPRVSYCDLKIRQMQNVQTYTVQCVLSLNIFLEKMFLLSWCCIMVANVTNACSLVLWTVRIVSDNVSTRFVEHLFCREMLDSREIESWEKLKQELKPDGIFMLRMVSRNTNNVLTSDLVRHLMLRICRHNNSGQGLDLASQSEPRITQPNYSPSVSTSPRQDEESEEEEKKEVKQSVHNYVYNYN